MGWSQMHQMGGNVQTPLFSKVYCLLLYLVVLFTILFTVYSLQIVVVQMAQLFVEIASNSVA